MADPTALFSTAEARAFETALTTVDYPDTAITAAEARIRAAITGICGVYFIPTTTTELIDGVASTTIRVSGHNPLKEQPPRPITVSAASIDGTALTVTELADLACYPDGRIVRKTLGSWEGAGNHLNVSITYRHGWATVPGEIARAALQLLCAQIIKSDISGRARSYSDGVMTYQLGFPGPAPHWFGIDEVDAVLDRFRERRVVIA